MTLQWFQILGGLGLFVFSLHFLEQTLQLALQKGLRPWLNRMLKSPLHILAGGLGSTLVVQASSISIVLAMGLLNSHLILLEQGFIFMLAAALGSSLKSLIYAFQIHIHLGLVLILSSILIYPFSRSGGARHLRIIVMSIGYSLIGLAMLSYGLAPLWESPALLQWFKVYDGSSLPSQVFYVICGAFLTLIVRSSTVLVFLVLEFSLTGDLPLSIGAALILGGNLGTTLDPLLMARKSETMAQRLAWGHLLVKAGGVLITLFSFNYFISWIDAVIPGLPLGENLLLHLAAVHIGFNLVNLLWWLFFLNFVLNFLAWALPNPQSTESVFLAPVVRRMIVNSPEHALDEVEHQLGQALNLAKRLTDECFALLNQKKLTRGLEATAIPDPNFELVKEGIYEVLLGLSQKNQMSPTQKSLLQSHLLRLSHCNYLFQTSRIFREHLEAGFYQQSYNIPVKIDSYFERFQHEFNEVWLAILLERQTYNAEELESLLETMEQGYFDYLQTGAHDPAYHAWLYQILAFLRQETVLVYQLYRNLNV